MKVQFRPTLQIFTGDTNMNDLEFLSLITLWWRDGQIILNYRKINRVKQVHPRNSNMSKDWETRNSTMCIDSWKQVNLINHLISPINGLVDVLERSPQLLNEH